MNGERIINIYQEHIAEQVKKQKDKNMHHQDKQENLYPMFSKCMAFIKIGRLTKT